MCGLFWVNNSYRHVKYRGNSIRCIVQMVSNSGIVSNTSYNTRCKLPQFFTRFCWLSLCMNFCKYGLQSYNIYFVFCNFHNPLLYHFMLVKNVQFDKTFCVWIILMCKLQFSLSVIKIFVVMTSKNQLETFKCKFLKIINF